jgi:hypothetical protein
MPPTPLAALGYFGYFYATLFGTEAKSSAQRRRMLPEKTSEMAIVATQQTSKIAFPFK